MPKSRRPAGNTGKRHLHVVPQPPAVPVNVAAAIRVLDSFTADFVRWFENSIGTAEEAKLCLKSVHAILKAHHKAMGKCSATAFTAEGVLAVVDDLGMDDPAFGKDLEAFLLVLDTYLDCMKPHAGPARPKTMRRCAGCWTTARSLALTSRS